MCEGGPCIKLLHIAIHVRHRASCTYPLHMWWLRPVPCRAPSRDMLGCYATAGWRWQVHVASRCVFSVTAGGMPTCNQGIMLRTILAHLHRGHLVAADVNAGQHGNEGGFRSPLPEQSPMPARGFEVSSEESVWRCPGRVAVIVVRKLYVVTFGQAQWSL